MDCCRIRQRRYNIPLIRDVAVELCSRVDRPGGYSHCPFQQSAFPGGLCAIPRMPGSDCGADQMRQAIKIPVDLCKSTWHGRVRNARRPCNHQRYDQYKDLFVARSPIRCGQPSDARLHRRSLRPRQRHASEFSLDGHCNLRPHPPFPRKEPFSPISENSRSTCSCSFSCFLWFEFRFLGMINAGVVFGVGVGEVEEKACPVQRKLTCCP